MNTTSDVKGIPEKIFVNRGTWNRSAAFDFLDYEASGGNKELLEFLWENYEFSPVGTKQVITRWERIRAALTTIQEERRALRPAETCEWVGFDEKLDDMEMMADTEWDFIHGNKILEAKHYWVGALWPYINSLPKLKTAGVSGRVIKLNRATRLWGWLAQWIKWIEVHKTQLCTDGRKPKHILPQSKARKSSEGESLRQWANSVQRRFKHEIPELPQNCLTTREAIGEQLANLEEAHRRDLMAVSLGILNTMVWIAKGKQPKDRKLRNAKAYLASANDRWPFFKKICPRCSWALLNTLVVMQRG